MCSRKCLFSGCACHPASPWHAKPFPALRCRSNATTKGGAPLLPGTDLAGLLEDSFSLAEAGQGNITRFLDLLL